MSRVAPPWEKRYYRKLLWTDVSVIVVTTVCAELVTLRVAAQPNLALLTWFSILLAAVWLLALAVFDTRNVRFYGSGVNEYRQVVNATLAAFGAIALLLLTIGNTPTRRITLLIALPLGLMCIVAGRWVWRKRLHAQRRKGSNSYRTLLVGDPNSSTQVLAQLRRNQLAGFHLVGAVTKNGSGDTLAPNVPVLAGFTDLLNAVDEHEIDVLIVLGNSKLSPKKIRRISWSLEDRNVQLILATSLTDIAGPRVHVRPVAGLPLIYVEEPVFSGWRIAVKRTLDILITLLVAIPATLIVLVLAVLIRLESGGPVFFKQERVGLNGNPFVMYKLRSMKVGAEGELPSLLEESDGNKVLFKMRNDPRITRLGHFMRRHSLDELPQLFNVLRGDMSLVGPRPPLARETDLYKPWLHKRRFLVKPGISGLWQVNGRSELSWEESVRLDLYYVENWTVLGDLLILWRTLRLVLQPRGAY